MGLNMPIFFWDEVSARGGVITAAQTYDSKETDFNHIIKRLVGTFYLEDRKDEYKIELKKWMKQHKNPSTSLETPQKLT